MGRAGTCGHRLTFVDITGSLYGAKNVLRLTDGRTWLAPGRAGARCPGGRRRPGFVDHWQGSVLYPPVVVGSTNTFGITSLLNRSNLKGAPVASGFRAASHHARNRLRAAILHIEETRLQRPKKARDANALCPL